MSSTMHFLVAGYCHSRQGQHHQYLRGSFVSVLCNHFVKHIQQTRRQIQDTKARAAACNGSPAQYTFSLDRFTAFSMALKADVIGHVVAKHRCSAAMADETNAFAPRYNIHTTQHTGLPDLGRPLKATACLRIDPLIWPLILDLAFGNSLFGPCKVFVGVEACSIPFVKLHS